MLDSLFDLASPQKAKACRSHLGSLRVQTPRGYHSSHGLREQVVNSNELITPTRRNPDYVNLIIPKRMDSLIVSPAISSG